MNKTRLQEIIDRYKVESEYVTSIIQRLKEVKKLTQVENELSSLDRQQICNAYYWAGIGKEPTSKKFESGVESKTNLAGINQNLLIEKITNKQMTKKVVNIGTVLVNNNCKELDRMVYNYGNGIYPVEVEVYVPSTEEVLDKINLKQLLQLVKQNKWVISSVNVKEDERQDFVNQNYDVNHNDIINLQDKLAFDNEFTDYIFYGIYFPNINKENSFNEKLNYFGNIYPNFNNNIINYLNQKISKDLEFENKKLTEIKSFYKQKIKREVKSQERDILNAKRILSEEFEK